jgi:RNA ligase (TIGR02306 family)
MKLASIEKIHTVIKHPNADALDIVGVLGYKAIVKRDQYKVGDLIVFIQPDTVLPDKTAWAAFYKSKSSRVKAVKLRGEWSMGIVESIQNVFGIEFIQTDGIVPFVEGVEVSEKIGVIKYEPLVPADLSAKGLLPYGIPKTDEERYQNLGVRGIPYQATVDVTLKIDGQSWTAYAKLEDGTVKTGICGRTLEFKESATNNYTLLDKKYRILEKLTEYAQKHNVSIAIRGESYGQGIQAFKLNPHSSMQKDLAIFSVYLIDEKRHTGKGEQFYFRNVAADLNLPTVTILEDTVILTPEIIQKYDENLKEVNGKPFEGVVINVDRRSINGGVRSFKVINKYYDSSK